MANGGGMASNFDFIKREWPSLFDECVRAERYAHRDPRASTIYARRVLEQAVRHVYTVAALPPAYRNDLDARINAYEMKNLTGEAINQKMNLVRKVGNAGAHEKRPIPPKMAEGAVRDLFHIVYWTAFHYSKHPDVLPKALEFDPALLAPPAPAEKPLSNPELNGLLVKFQEQDDALAKEREVNEALAAEVEQLRAEVRAAQAAKVTTVDTHDYDEAQTRTDLIDVLLREAGWLLTEDRDREYEVAGMPVSPGSNTGSGIGYVDYVLWGDDGLPLAVVEAKRASRDPAIGQQQAKLYADCLEAMTGQRPAIFWTNGMDHWLWDDAAGYPPREVQGFYTKDELALLVQRRTTGLPLTDTVIDKEIVGRHYQTRAIRAIDDAFERKQRQALLVMATGSGKTRTVIALVDQLMKAGWAKRVLFLADRTALVTQAANAFKTHLPGATTVNLVTEKITDGRVYVSTYPTMMNLINDIAVGPDGEQGMRKFGPGYFDLVVIDEAHRSVYQKYRAIFSWFDSLLVGLTATPKDEVDRNTYTLFHLENGVPTDAYSLDEAVLEGYLVPPVPVSVPLKFARQGIKYDDLSEEEKDEWDSAEWTEDGDVPDGVSAEEVNRWLFNIDTVDKALAKLMSDGHKVAGGDRIGKTIIFAKNQAHAEFIKLRFDANYPEYAGHHARVITHSVSYAQSLIDDFSQKEKAPHIAISVDMLDTGIDVPEVVNLVFFKMVRAKSKFWQMIGRGTRLCEDLYGPGDDKKNFFVFDFCENLEYFGQDPPGSEGSLQKSLSERLFEARLGLVTALDLQLGPSDVDPPEGEGIKHERGLRVDIAHILHQIVAGMNLDNFLVRPARRWVEEYGLWTSWKELTPEKAAEIAERLAGLPSTLRDEDEQAKRFDLLLLRLQLAQLDGDAVLGERLRLTVQEIAASLLGKTNIPAVARQLVLLDDLAGDQWWVDVTLPMLELARRRVRELVRFVDQGKQNAVYTDLVDEIGEGTIVDLPGVSVGTNWERFRAKARAYLRDHEDHVALQRLRRNKQLTPDDLASLEQILLDSGAGNAGDIARAKEESQGLGLFIRSLVGLDRAAAVEAFSRFLSESTYTAQQIRFVNLIIEELTQNGAVKARRLFEPPFTDHAPQGPDAVFSGSDIEGIVGVLNEIEAHAAPEITVA